MKRISLFFSGISNKSYSLAKAGNITADDITNSSVPKAGDSNAQNDEGMQICSSETGRKISLERSVSLSRRSSAKTSELPSGKLNILYCNTYREISFSASFYSSASFNVSQQISASSSSFIQSSPSLTPFSASLHSLTPSSTLSHCFSSSSPLSHSSGSSSYSRSSDPSVSCSSLYFLPSASVSASIPARNPDSYPNSVSDSDCCPNSVLTPDRYSKPGSIPNNCPKRGATPYSYLNPGSSPNNSPDHGTHPYSCSNQDSTTTLNSSPNQNKNQNQIRNPAPVSGSRSGVTGYDPGSYSEFSGEVLCLELFCREYMEHKSLRQKTRSFYEKVISCHIAPHYDKFLDLRSLTPIRVAEIIIKPIIAEDKISTAYNTRNTIVAVINHARIVHDLSMYPQFGNFNTLSQLARIPQRCDYEKSFAAMINGDIGENIAQIFELFHQRVKNIKILVLLELTFHLCLRQNEVLNIRKSNIDFKNHCLHITETKTISARKGGFDVPLTSQTEELLKYIIKAETNREKNAETETVTEIETEPESESKSETRSKIKTKSEAATGRRKTTKSTAKEQEEKKNEKDETRKEDKADNRDPEKKNELSTDKKGDSKETGRIRFRKNSTKKDPANTSDAPDLPDPSATEMISDSIHASDKNTERMITSPGSKQGRKKDSPDLKDDKEIQDHKVSETSGKSTDQDDYIFTSAKLGKRIATNALGVYFNRIDGLRGNQTAHGIRAIFKTWAHRNKIDDTVSECVLSHRCWSKVAISYNRDLATYLYTDRQELMKKWSDFLSDSIGNNSILKRSTDETKSRKGRKQKDNAEKS